MAEEALNQEQDQQDVDTQDVETEERSFAIPSILEAVADEETGDDEEESDDDSEDGEEQEPAADGDQQEEGESESSDSDSEDGEVISSFKDLVDHYNLDWDYVRGLKVSVNVDGKTTEPTFSELLGSYRTDEQQKEIKTKAQSLVKEAEETRDASTQELATASAMVRLVEESVLKGELEQLNQLKTEHGAGSDEYQAAREALATKAQTLARAKQEISQKLSAALEQRNAQPSDEDYAEAQTKLFELHPELKEDENRTKLVQFAIGLGFTEEQLQTETNPLLFSLAWRALQHDETKAKANAAKKKVTKIPRMMKPSAQQPAQRNQRWDPGEALYGTS